MEELLLFSQLSIRMIDKLNAQDCLYHVNLQGIENGKEINSYRLIDVISRALNPYSEYDEFLKSLTA